MSTACIRWNKKVNERWQRRQRQHLYKSIYANIERVTVLGILAPISMKLHEVDGFFVPKFT